MAGALTAQQAVTYQGLLDDIQRGVFPPGGRLPSERALSVTLGVSRVTLRAALGRLAEEGWLERSAQRGWYVASQVVGEPPSTLQSFSEMAAARGLRASSELLERTIRPATLEESARLRIAPTAPVLYLRRLRGFNGLPVCLDTTVIPRESHPGLVDADLADRSLYAWLEQDGTRVHRASYAVHAEAADSTMAALLGVPAGFPLLVGDEIAYDADGLPVLIGTVRYRGDAYRFEADLFRRPS